MEQAVADGDAVEVEQVVDDAPEEQEGEQTSEEQVEQQTEAEDEGDEALEDEVVVTIGEESPTSQEDEDRVPPWVRELRKSNREKDRRLRQLEQENARLKGAGQQPAAVVVGDKPTLEGCDFDAGKFERELEAWHARKRDADDQERKKADAEKAEREAWNAKLEAYGKAKAALKVRDFEDAESAVLGGLNQTQQGIVVSGAENAAVLFYALGKNQAKLAQLASIQDPVKFAFAVAKLETQLKVQPRKSAPPPERRVRSSVAGAAAVDNQLEKLREEAARTGDLSKVIAFKNQQRRGK